MEYSDKLFVMRCAELVVLLESLAGDNEDLQAQIQEYRALIPEPFFEAVREQYEDAWYEGHEG